MREDSLSGVNGLHAEIIGQLAVRHRVTRAWAYRIYKNVIDLEFKLLLLSLLLCGLLAGCSVFGARADGYTTKFHATAIGIYTTGAGINPRAAGSDSSRADFDSAGANLYARDHGTDH